MWWLGQSRFLIRWGEKFLLIDPYLSDSLSVKYAETDKPHIRMTGMPVSPERLDFIHLVTSSHNHTDHLDAETLVPLLGSNPGVEVLAPEANREFVAERLGIEPGRVNGLVSGENLELGGFQCVGVPAAHEDRDQDEAGRDRFMGYVFRFGGWSVYHSGDTIPFEGLLESITGHSIDLALLPINGRAEARGVAGNLWGREAAELASQSGARLAVPCHYDMFSFNTATPDEFVQRCHQLDQPYRVLRCAERWSSFELDGARP